MKQSTKILLLIIIAVAKIMLILILKCQNKIIIPPINPRIIPLNIQETICLKITLI